MSSRVSKFSFGHLLLLGLGVKLVLLFTVGSKLPTP